MNENDQHIADGWLGLKALDSSTLEKAAREKVPEAFEFEDEMKARLKSGLSKHKKVLVETLKEPGAGFGIGLITIGLLFSCPNVILFKQAIEAINVGMSVKEVLEVTPQLFLNPAMIEFNCISSSMIIPSLAVFAKQYNKNLQKRK